MRREGSEGEVVNKDVGETKGRSSGKPVGSVRKVLIFRKPLTAHRQITSKLKTPSFSPHPLRFTIPFLQVKACLNLGRLSGIKRCHAVSTCQLCPTRIEGYEIVLPLSARRVLPTPFATHAARGQFAGVTFGGNASGIAAL